MLAWGCFGAGLGVLWAGFGVAGACVVIPCLRSYACWPGLGSVGGITTIGAALRRVAGVSVVYGRKIPRVVAREGRRRVLFRWLCWSCSACLRVFVVVVWLVFVGGLGGIATIGAALRRVAGVSGVYGRKIPRGCLEGPASRALSVAVLVVFGMSSCVCRGGVACVRWWLGGNCYHRRCLAACRRRVGGLWSQNPPRGCSEGPGPRARRGVYGRKTPGWLLKVQSTSVVCG